MKLYDWKKKHGSIQKVKIGENVIYYRPLTASEFNVVAELENRVPDEELEDVVIGLCVLNPDEITSMGDMGKEQLSDFILKTSAPEEDEFKNLVKEIGDSSKTNVFKVLISQVLQMVPAYTVDQLLNKNIYQLLEILSISKVARSVSEEQPPQSPPGYPPLQQRKKAVLNKDDLNNISIEASTNDLAKEIAKATGKAPRRLEEVKQEQANRIPVLEGIRNQNTKVEKILNLRK